MKDRGKTSFALEQAKPRLGQMPDREPISRTDDGVLRHNIHTFGNVFRPHGAMAQLHKWVRNERQTLCFGPVSSPGKFRKLLSARASARSCNSAASMWKAEYPSRQAFCASAQAMQLFPTPVGSENKEIIVILYPPPAPMCGKYGTRMPRTRQLVLSAPGYARIKNRYMLE